MDGVPCECEIRGNADELIVLMKYTVNVAGGIDPIIAIRGSNVRETFANGDSVDHTFTVYLLEYEPIPDNFLTTQKYLTSKYNNIAL